MRTRNIKPNFFKNDILGGLDPLARILFSGLWCLADREGRLEDRPLRIKAEILPFDDCDADALLSVLHENGFITRYSSDGKNYIDIPKFSSHQHPNIKEAESVIPPPEADREAHFTPQKKEHCESTVPSPSAHGESSPLYLKPNTLNLIPHTLNPIPEDPSEEVLSHFEKVTNKSFRDRETPKALITKTLKKGFSPKELMTATDKLSSEWKDTKYSYLLTPSYIFGDKFEELLLREEPKKASAAAPAGNFSGFSQDRPYDNGSLDSFCNRGF